MVEESNFFDGFDWVALRTKSIGSPFKNMLADMNISVDPYAMEVLSIEEEIDDDEDANAEETRKNDDELKNMTKKELKIYFAKFLVKDIKTNITYCKLNQTCKSNRGGMNAEKAVNQHILDHVNKVLGGMKCEKCQKVFVRHWQKVQHKCKK